MRPRNPRRLPVVGFESKDSQKLQRTDLEVLPLPSVQNLLSFLLPCASETQFYLSLFWISNLCSIYSSTTTHHHYYPWNSPSDSTMQPEAPPPIVTPPIDHEDSSSSAVLRAAKDITFGSVCRFLITRSTVFRAHCGMNDLDCRNDIQSLRTPLRLDKSTTPVSSARCYSAVQRSYRLSRTNME